MHVRGQLCIHAYRWFLAAYVDGWERSSRVVAMGAGCCRRESERSIGCSPHAHVTRRNLLDYIPKYAGCRYILVYEYRYVDSRRGLVRSGGGGGGSIEQLVHRVLGRNINLFGVCCCGMYHTES